MTRDGLINIFFFASGILLSHPPVILTRHTLVEIDALGFPLQRLLNRHISEDFDVSLLLRQPRKMPSRSNVEISFVWDDQGTRPITIRVVLPQYEDTSRRAEPRRRDPGTTPVNNGHTRPKSARHSTSIPPPDVPCHGVRCCAGSARGSYRHARAYEPDEGTYPSEEVDTIKITYSTTESVGNTPRTDRRKSNPWRQGSEDRQNSTPRRGRSDRANKERFANSRMNGRPSERASAPSETKPMSSGFGRGQPVCPTVYGPFGHQVHTSGWPGYW
ncbi:hypothetical protein F5Y18DRAFT_368934 [Xylariaceae sp. FL1019]|nr:hypothetical protein F5Y18DRAFT_368934 [Xylariaceae sp. FL1019]